MSTRWNPRISRFSSSGGGPPPQIQDHFAPKIIVGNVPNGDPAVPQAFPFRYIPDPGDGSGIAQALLEAGAAAQQGDVYIRPGVYDFGLFAGALPLTVPPGTSLRGPGPSVPVSIGGNPNSGALIRTSPTQRSLFVLGSTSAFRQIGVEVTTPAPGAVGSYVLDAGITGAPAFIDQVPIAVTADETQAGNESLLAIVRGDFITLREVIMGRFGGTPYRTGSLIGIDAVDPQLGAVQVQGLDTGVRAVGGTFINVTLIEHVDALVFSGGGGGVRVSDLVATAERNGIVFSSPLDGSAVIVNAQVFGGDGQGGPATGIGVDVQASPGGTLHLSNSRVTGWAQGVRLSANDSQLSNVRIDAQLVGVDLFAASDVTISGCVIGGFGAPGSQGILVRPGSDNATISGSRVKNWDSGVDVQAQYATIVSSNLRFNTVPLLVLPAVSGNTESAHNQV